jgi:antitoxin CptB
VTYLNLTDPLPPVSRLQWQCRRGMLELDYLLREFLDQRYPRLDEAQQRAFVRLLDYPDQILQDWFMGRSVPREAGMQLLVDAIRRRD